MDLSQLKNQCIQCEKCSLSQTRTHVVFGTGVENAEVMLIGEGPGEQEDKQGLPFVGRSGQLLDCYLESIGLSREKNIFIANIVKCRPPNNRDPLAEESTACLPWLREQFRLIQPKIVVCLGRVAAQKIIRPDFSVTKEHGQWTEKNGIFFTATLHPAALLRNPSQKPSAFEDFVKIREKIQEVCTHTYS